MYIGSLETFNRSPYETYDVWEYLSVRIETMIHKNYTQNIYQYCMHIMIERDLNDSRFTAPSQTHTYTEYTPSLPEIFQYLIHISLTLV